MIVDRVWNLDTKLSKKKLHRLFYSDLVSMGFRAHHAKEIYAYAKSVVESARSNGGRRPILKRLAARMDKYDYELDLEGASLTLKLHNNHEVRLKLMAPRGRVEKYRGLEQLRAGREVRWRKLLGLSVLQESCRAVEAEDRNGHRPELRQHNASNVHF
jgi:putative transposase